MSKILRIFAVQVAVRVEKILLMRRFISMAQMRCLGLTTGVGFYLGLLILLPTKGDLSFWQDGEEVVQGRD